MNKNNLLIVLTLSAVFLFWFILTKNNFFHWDEWNFFSIFSKDPKYFLFHSYGEHYIPLTELNHYILFKLFGLKYFPFQLPVIGFHILNTLILYKIILKETKNAKIALFCIPVFGISSVYVDNITWAVGITGVGSALFVSLGYLSYIKFIETKKNLFLVLSSLSLLISPLFNDFGVLAPFAFILFPYLSNSLSKIRFRISSVYFLSGIFNLLVLLIFSGKNIIHSALPVSIGSFLQMIEFVLFGVVRGTILRFLYPGFHIIKDGQTLKSIFFLALALIVFVFLLKVFIAWLKDEKFRRERISKTIIYLSLIAVGYLAASIGRSSNGLAHAGISRYTYQSFFFLVVMGAYVFKDFKNKFKLIAVLFTFIWLINLVAIIQFEQGFWQLMVNRDKQFAADLSYLFSHNREVYDFPTKGFFETLKISDFWFLVPKDKSIRYIKASEFNKKSCIYCIDKKTYEIYNKFTGEYQVKFD